MTIQNAPPGLDYDRDKKFSKVRDDDDIVKMREEEQNNFFTNYKAGAIDSQSGAGKMNSEKSPLNKITSQAGTIDIKQTEQNECLNKDKKIPETKIQEPNIWKRNEST
ncbi:hypothetical protein VIGAN_05272500 [Vigna angularis var. angularis]|uniref:Uncharacterized protein n=1 Tax=Vigna angularis var. angularis TaxID=157739 RepID=A0A0S3S891_PHAAN|nr:hypothetical protein VIGAN_05272500 [Vigna angularis var. angularis]